MNIRAIYAATLVRDISVDNGEGIYILVTKQGKIANVIVTVTQVLGDLKVSRRPLDLMAEENKEPENLPFRHRTLEIIVIRILSHVISSGDLSISNSGFCCWFLVL